MQVIIRDNNMDQALKALKKKLQREGVFREMKLRRHYEKPSERRAAKPPRLSPRPQGRAQAPQARGLLSPYGPPVSGGHRPTEAAAARG